MIDKARAAKVLRQHIVTFSRRAADVRLRHPRSPEFAYADEGSAHGVTCAALEMGLMTIEECGDATAEGARQALDEWHAAASGCIPTGGHP